MLKNCLILLHVKRKDKAIIPKIIQFGSWLQIISERIKRVGIKQACIEAKHYNVNHTALVYYENGVYKLFQADATNNVHTLLLSDYLANTEAQVYASIYYDAEYTQESKEMLLKWIIRPINRLGRPMCSMRAKRLAMANVRGLVL